MQPYNSYCLLQKKNKNKNVWNCEYKICKHNEKKKNICFLFYWKWKAGKNCRKRQPQHESRCLKNFFFLWSTDGTVFFTSFFFFLLITFSWILNDFMMRDLYDKARLHTTVKYQKSCNEIWLQNLPRPHRLPKWNENQLSHKLKLISRPI